MIDILTGAVRSGASVLFPCLGEVVAERSGIINLGTEGCMLVGACSAFAVTVHTGSVVTGVAAGAGAGALLALLHAYLVIARGANQIASGLAATTLGLGLSAFFGESLVNQQIQGLEPWPVPVLSSLPGIGPVLFQHDPLTYFSLILIPLVWFFLFRTRWGMVLRATGERPEVVVAGGYSVNAYRYGATIFGGALAGLGGAQLSIAYTLSWVGDMVQGRGFVAVALVVFASWSPLRTVWGAFLFGGAMTLQLYLQARGVEVSPFLLSMTPYLLTLGVLVAVGQKKHVMPEALRRVFEGTSAMFRRT